MNTGWAKSYRGDKGLPQKRTAFYSVHMMMMMMMMMMCMCKHGYCRGTGTRRQISANRRTVYFRSPVTVICTLYLRVDPLSQFRNRKQFSNLP